MERECGVGQPASPQPAWIPLGGVAFFHSLFGPASRRPGARTEFTVAVDGTACRKRAPPPNPHSASCCPLPVGSLGHLRARYSCFTKDAVWGRTLHARTLRHTHTHTDIPHPVGQPRQSTAAAFRSWKRVHLREVPGYRPSKVGVRRFWGYGQAMSAVDDRHTRATRSGPTSTPRPDLT